MIKHLKTKVVINMKKVTSVMLAFAVVFSLYAPPLSAYASENNLSAYAYLSQDNESDIAAIKDRWKKFLVGDGSDTDEQYVKDYIYNYVDTYNGVGGCSYAINTYHEPGGNTPPWRDAISTGADAEHQFVSIEALAKGYSMVGSTYYKDAETLRKIKAALSWMYKNCYNSETDLNGKVNANYWYSWMISSPRALVNTLILLEDELEAEYIEKGVAAINHFVGSINGYFGSNRIYFAKIMLGSALLSGNTEKLEEALAALEEEFTYVSGEAAQGFHSDGTYLYHTRHFLNGTYGAEHFELLPEIASFVKESQYAFAPELVSNLFEIYRNSFEPLISDGEMIAMANGRIPYDDATKAVRVMKSALNLINVLDGIDEYTDECNKIKAKLKKYYSASSDYQGLSIDLFKQAYTIANDTSLPDANDYRITKIYTDGDKAVHHSKSFMTAISMSSSRVYNYESLHDGYTKGWYLGDGMQYIYMPGDTQYDKAWLNESDPYKRPGTTVDTQTRIAAKIKQGSEYLSSKDFVGGAALNSTGVAAMELESYHNYNPNAVVKLEGSVAGDSPNHTSSLTAKKAWFMFDDEVVSLGTDISANDGFEVRTIIDNRRMERTRVYINDNQISNLLEYPSTKHLNLNNEIGYVFPDTTGENVTINLNTQGDNKYVEAWISHGVSPTNADYAYITLPGITKEQTASYAASPDAVVLRNTSSVQAVKDNSTSTTGYVFWEAASYNGITADNACTLIVNEDSGMMSMAVSDPTHKLDTITLTLENSIAVPAEIPENVSFEIKNGNTVINVDTSDNSGKSYEFSCYTLPQDYEADKPYVKSIDLHTADSSASADFVVLNPSSDLKMVNLILAIYDEEGTELKTLIFKETPISANSSYCETVGISAPAPCMVKAFVWEGLEPLINTRDYNSIIKLDK